MPYSIIFARSFEKDYARKNAKIQKAFDERFILFTNDQFDPILNNHKLTAEYVGCRSINITGDIRAIFRLDENNIVVFIRIGTHDELYGK